MTLILELSPEVEARLQMNATAHGQEITEYLLTLAENDPVIDLTEFKDRQDFDESVAGIRESLADLEAERTVSFDEMFAKLETHLNEREKQQKVNAPSQEKAA